MPTWLPDELLKRFGPLPHNPNNVKPAPPAAADQLHVLEEGEVPPVLTVAMTQGDNDLFCPLTLSPAPLPVLLCNATSNTPTPVIVPKEEAIDLEALVKLSAKEAIDLIYLDDDKNSVSYYVYSPTTSVHEITAPGAEEDMHPGEGWKVFTVALDQDLFYLADETGTMTITKYLKYKLGWMDDEMMLSGSLGKGRPSHTKPLVASPWSMPIGMPHSQYDLSLFKKALQWDADIDEAIWDIGDCRLQADIRCYQQIPGQMSAAQKDLAAVEEKEREAHQAWTAWQWQVANLECDKADIHSRLVTANAHPWLQQKLREGWQWHADRQAACSIVPSIFSASRAKWLTPHQQPWRHRQPCSQLLLDV